jgi:hypothetical protein
LQSRLAWAGNYVYDSLKGAHITGASLRISDISELGGRSLAGYKIYQTLPLTKRSNQLDGLLILLIDKRVAGLEATLRSDGYDPMEHLDTKFESEAYSLPEKDILQALLLVVDSEKKVVYSEELGRESARLDRVFLYRDKAKPTFIITTDYSIGAGSYNGPISRLLEVTEKGIVYLLPDNTGLMNSLKAAWATVDGNGSKDIIFKSCHPDYDAKQNTDGSSNFLVVYGRFRFDGKAWKKTTHTKPGFWENDFIGSGLDKREFLTGFTTEKR